jgi:uncharacterized protein
LNIAELWRYPVKSMAGEMVESSSLSSLGMGGDRVVHIEDRYGRVITARTHPGLLGHHATLGADGEPLVDGRPWTDAHVLHQVERIVGPGARLVRDESAARFDILPLLVATDGAVSSFGHDRRRLRPNLLVGGVPGLAERGWPESVLRIGTVLIGVQDLRGRCVMTTFDPDNLAQDRNVLRGIIQKFEGKLALNCYVIQGGEIRVGDPVERFRREESSAGEGRSGGSTPHRLA